MMVEFMVDWLQLVIVRDVCVCAHVSSSIKCIQLVQCSIRAAIILQYSTLLRVKPNTRVQLQTAMPHFETSNIIQYNTRTFSSVLYSSRNSNVFFPSQHGNKTIRAVYIYSTERNGTELTRTLTSHQCCRKIWHCKPKESSNWLVDWIEQLVQ